MPKKSQTSSWKWDQRTIGFVAILIFAVIGTYFLTKSYAAPKPRSSSGSGTCTVTPPSPIALVPAGVLYTVTGSNIPSGYTGNYWTVVSGGLATSYVGTSSPDSNGNTTASAYVYHPGTYTAQITGQNVTKGKITAVVLATCSFTAQ